MRADERGACLEALTVRIGSDGWARLDLIAKKAEGAPGPGAVELSCRLETLR